jgi:hypothetical protein
LRICRDNQIKRIVRNIEKDTKEENGASKVFGTEVPANCLEDMYWFGEIPKNREERRQLLQKKARQTNMMITGLMGSDAAADGAVSRNKRSNKKQLARVRY